MLCVLREALPDKARMFETHGYRISKGRGYFVFKFPVMLKSVGRSLCVAAYNQWRWKWKMMMMMISSSVCVCLLTNERYRTTAAPWSSCGRISWSAKGCASTGGGTPTRSSRSTASTRRRTGGRRPTCSSSTPATGGRTARRPEGTGMFCLASSYLLYILNGVHCAQTELLQGRRHAVRSIRLD